MPMLILGESRRKALIAQLTSRVQIWLKEWAVARQIDVTIELSEEGGAFDVELLSDRTLVGTANGAAQLAITASGDVWSGISGSAGRSLFLTAGSGAIAGRVNKQMIH